MQLNYCKTYFIIAEKLFIELQVIGPKIDNDKIQERKLQVISHSSEILNQIWKNLPV